MCMFGFESNCDECRMCDEISVKENDEETVPASNQG